MLKSLCITLLLLAVASGRRGPCHRRLAEVTEILNSEPFLVGLTPPNCERDGTYSPKQCSGAACYCVDPAGKQIPDYRAKTVGQELHCNCAVDKHAYTKTGLIGLRFDCDQHGDYEAIQCIGSVCFCADRVTGQQSGEDRPIHEYELLAC